MAGVFVGALFLTWSVAGGLRLEQLSYVAERSREDAWRAAKRGVVGDKLSQLRESRPETDVVCVTGTTKGIGKATVAELRKRGYEVTSCGRKDSDYNFDLADLEATARAAEHIRERKPKVLVLNAGVWPTLLEYTVDDLELGFQVNHLAQFLLYKKLEASVERVVVLSSIAHASCDDLRLDDLEWRQRPFDTWQNYAATKLMNLLFVKELARRGVDAVGVHPGFVSTNLFRSFSLDTIFDAVPDPFGFKPAIVPSVNLQPLNAVLEAVPVEARGVFKTPTDAARDVVYAAIEPQSLAGLYLADAEPTPVLGDDARLAARLWDASETLLGPYLP